jgi:hypothetical protein
MFHFFWISVMNAENTEDTEKNICVFVFFRILSL